LNSKPSNSASNIFNGLIYLSVFIAFLTFVLKSPGLISRLVSPVQVQQEEAVNLEFGRLIAAGQSLYPDIRQGGPYIHCSYPPLFPYLESQFLKSSPNPWLPGRLLAWVGYLGCGVLIAFAGWKRWGLNAWVFLLPVLLWISPTWATWGSMVRMDTLLLFVNFSAFLILLWNAERAEGNTKSFIWFVGGLLNAVAILMKPTALTLTLVMMLWAVLKRKPKDLLWFLLGALGPVSIFLVVAQWQTGGMYWIHTIRWAALGFSPERFFYFMFHGFFKEAGWLLILVLLTAGTKKLPILLKLQLALSFLSLWTLSRDGSAENYYMEFVLYGLFAVGEGWGKKDAESEKLFWLPYAGGLLLLTGTILLSLAPSPSVPSADEIKMKESVAAIYQKGQYHLALDNDFPVMADKPIWYQPSGIISIVQAGAWDPAPLIRDIQVRKFTTVEFYDLPHQTLYPPIVERAVLQNYRIGWKAYGRVWYVPKT
jgi:hypothetical protein